MNSAQWFLLFLSPARPPPVFLFISFFSFLLFFLSLPFFFFFGKCFLLFVFDKDLHLPCSGIGEGWEGSRKANVLRFSHLESRTQCTEETLLEVA